MQTSLKRNVLFGAITLLSLLIVAELILRIVVHLSIDYATNRDDINYQYRLWQMHLFDSFMGMHEPDPELFWKMKPNYRSSFVSTNSDGLASPPILEKEQGTYRILFLGDSTPLGLGQESSRLSFVWKVDSLLHMADPGRKVEVINAAVAGYSSWQCRKFLELNGERLQPDLVVTYFGNNDPSSNGYLSDHQLYDKTRHSFWLNRVLAHSYCYELLKGLVLKIKESRNAGSILQPRVTIDEFAENVEVIKSWCDQNHLGLLCCTVPIPLLWPPGIQFKPFAQGKDKSGRLVMAEEMQKNIDASWAICLDTSLLPGTHDQWTEQVYGGVYHDVGSAQEVEARLRAELANKPADPRLLNNLGVALFREGKEADSALIEAIEHDSLSPTILYNLGVTYYRSNPNLGRNYLERAKEADQYSLRIKSAYNRKLKSICDSLNIPLVDLVSVFQSLPDSEYFVDHCHPTTAGHSLMAKEIVNSITRIWRN